MYVYIKKYYSWGLNHCHLFNTKEKTKKNEKTQLMIYKVAKSKVAITQGSEEST